MKQPNNPYSYNEYYDAPDGNRYHWDPDFQQWFQVLTPEQYAALSHWEKFHWVYTSFVITIGTMLYFYITK